MKHLILTVDQANHVRGSYESDHELQPVLLASGQEYILPIEVLSDPAFEQIQNYLEKLPQRDILKNELKAEYE